jgi:hypothetical protein
VWKRSCGITNESLRLKGHFARPSPRRGGNDFATERRCARPGTNHSRRRGQSLGHERSFSVAKSKQFLQVFSEPRYGRNAKFLFPFRFNYSDELAVIALGFLSPGCQTDNLSAASGAILFDQDIRFVLPA